MGGRYVLSHQHGMGDCLLLSTIPERYARLGHTVLRWNGRPNHNVEVTHLLWSSNPWIAGVSAEQPTIGYERHGRQHELARDGVGAIAAVEMAHDLPPPYSKYPRLYVEPARRTDIGANVVLMDFSSRTVAFSAPQIDDFMREMILPRYHACDLRVVRHKPGVATYDPVPHCATLRSLPVVTPASLIDYLSWVYSVRAFVTGESGMQGIASAVRADRQFPEIHSLISTETNNLRLFNFPNVEYTPVYATGSDWRRQRPEYEAHMHAKGNGLVRR